MTDEGTYAPPWRRVPNSTPRLAPGNARIIVFMHVAFEGYAGPTIHASQSIAPGFKPDAIARGKVNHIGLSWQEYGAKQGMRRLQRLLDKHSIPATAAVSGIAAERYPDLVREWVRAGHEVCAHSWAQDVDQFELGKDEEREMVRRCVGTIESATGERPLGWVSPAGQLGDYTLRTLAEEGFTYTLDIKDDDVPYVIEVEGDHHLVSIPNLYDVNDITLYANARQPPEAYLSLFTHSFDVLYEEGATQTKMLNAVAHPPLFGRPFGAWAFEAAIRYAKQFPDVWFARRRDVADWVLSDFHAAAEAEASGHSPGG
jgi:allantoinase